MRLFASSGLVAMLVATAFSTRVFAAPPERVVDRVTDRAKPRPPVVLAVIAGVATALIPVALGTMFTAGANSDGQRNVGYAVAGAGIALSPIASHVVLGEWKRAAVFGAFPVASEIAITSILAAKPDAVFQGTTFSRTTFAVLMSIDIFGAALGLVDVMMAGERWGAVDKPADKASTRPLKGFSFAPTIGQGRAGIAFGATL